MLERDQMSRSVFISVERERIVMALIEDRQGIDHIAEFRLRIGLLSTPDRSNPMISLSRTPRTLRPTKQGLEPVQTR